MITTTATPQGRRNVLDLVPRRCGERNGCSRSVASTAIRPAFCCITNDGDLAYQLTHPKFGVAKEYRVLCAGLASDEQIRRS